MSLPARAYHHGQLRDTLIAAGVELARTGGPEAVVLRAVARDAGVSHNAAYRHFADREDLLAAVCHVCLAKLAFLMEDRLDEVSTRGRVKRAWDHLDVIGRAYIEFARTEPGWFRTAFAVPAQHDEAAARAGIGRSGLGAYGLLGRTLDELVEVGALPPDRRPGAEYAAWSMVHGLSALLVEGPLRSLPDEEVGRALRVSLGVVQRGL